MSPDDAESSDVRSDRFPSVPNWVRTAAIGLVAGVAGGATATVVDPESTVATLGLILLVVAAVTVLAGRLG